LETFCRAVKNENIHENMKNRRYKNNNITEKDKTFLNTIKGNPEIIIKKAGKGSAVVIMNTTDYLREGYTTT
jgi:hypothetical protein